MSFIIKLDYLKINGIIRKQLWPNHNYGMVGMVCTLISWRERSNSSLVKILLHKTQYAYQTRKSFKENVDNEIVRASFLLIEMVLPKRCSATSR